MPDPNNPTFSPTLPSGAPNPAFVPATNGNPPVPTSTTSAMPLHARMDDLTARVLALEGGRPSGTPPVGNPDDAMVIKWAKNFLSKYASDDMPGTAANPT